MNPSATKPRTAAASNATVARDSSRRTVDTAAFAVDSDGWSRIDAPTIARADGTGLEASGA